MGGVALCSRLVDAVSAAKVHALVSPLKLWRRSEVLHRPSPVPAAAGVYAWWFDEPPADFSTVGCAQSGDLTLLYTGISPKRPPQNGRPPSRGHLRQRLRTHYAGNAEGSTLRKTLGCLLSAQLGIELRRVGSGTRRTFIDGEADLSRWMEEHALVSWVVHENPWELEDYAIATLDLPLNLDGNIRNAFYGELEHVRSRCTNRADELPIVANPGIGGR